MALKHYGTQFCETIRAAPVYLSNSVETNFKETAIIEPWSEALYYKRNSIIRAIKCQKGSLSFVKFGRARRRKHEMRCTVVPDSEN